MAGMNSGNAGGSSGSNAPWGHTAARTPAINQHQPSVGQASLKGAIDHFNAEHPFHTQGERLQNKAEKGIHHPVHDVYGGERSRR